MSFASVRKVHDAPSPEFSLPGLFVYRIGTVLLRLLFSRASGEQFTSLDVAQFSIAGGAMRGSRTGPPVAQHLDHSWLVGGQRYYQVQVADPVIVSLLDQDGEPSRVYGPYRDFLFVDSIAYAEGHVFAFMDAQSKDWYSVDAGRHWPTLLGHPPVNEDAI